MADQEALPFKMVYCLSHEQGGLRTFIAPEALHGSWNDTKNSIRRANLQHVLLLGTVMGNVMHGPFRSGRNAQTLQEAVEHLSKNIGVNEFEELQDLIASDRHVDPDDESVPQFPEDLPKMDCFRTTPVFVSWPISMKRSLNCFFRLFKCRGDHLISSGQMIYNIAAA